MEKKYVIGIDLGGTKIYTALTDLEGNIIKEKIVETEANKGNDVVLKNIFRTVEYVIEGIDVELIKAIGLGAPGPLDVKAGKIVYTPNLPFKDFDIVSPIRDGFNLPTYLDNDANAATLGEFLFGAGKGTTNMVFITCSTGIGGGAILNGKIYRGSTSNALEIGHTTVSRTGTRCGCGNIGCAEVMASGTSIMRRAKEAVASSAITSLKEYENVTAKEVFEEAAKGDRVSKSILDEALSYLGITVANLANAFDPDMIIVGGGVANGGPIVFEKIAEEMQDRCLKIILQNCRIEKAKLGGKAGVLGAAAIAITE
ncbi:MAG: ROK family protein [Clostridium sp.]